MAQLCKPVIETLHIRSWLLKIHCYTSTRFYHKFNIWTFNKFLHTGRLDACRNQLTNKACLVVLVWVLITWI